ncbi:MAG: sigma 54-interacting transcriptional regulator [Longimicrobiaceae bacterium]
MPASHIHLFSEARPDRDAGDVILTPALEFARRAANCTHPVLLCGETGTGKTHLARRIHEMSARAGKPFVRVNCAAVPESLFERELFGHVRGAFTDAREAGTGLLEAADGGTLFLDEIGELPLQMQPKLLAVLEDGSFRRLGSPREVQVDFRIITATHQCLTERVQQRQFRQDLFYRCSVLQHTLAPLRERRGDIAPIARFLLEKVASTHSLQPEITGEALAVIRSHTWPGNLRELENTLRCAAVFSDGVPIQPHHLSRNLPAAAMSRTEGESDGCAAFAGRYAAPAEEGKEVEMIRQALRAEGGNRTRAARRLGMSRSALWIKLQKYSFLQEEAGRSPIAERRIGPGED